MEYYDVIIVGAGIAGTGLAYNLSRIRPNKSVLVIDKKGLGGNEYYGYRNTFKDVIDKYNIPYEHRFDGIRIGTYEEPIQLENDFYLIDYTKACKHLFKNSNAIFKKEKGIKIRNQILYTNKNKYKFNFLIDCSGSSFFLRKIYNMPLPFRYWIGNVRILKNKVYNLDNYFYFCYSINEETYLEDFYPLKDKIIQGDWRYVDRIDFNLIRIPKNTLYKKLIKNPFVIKEKRAVIPSTFVFPLVFGRFAFLGDSFGNATTAASEGIRPILNSSYILAKAIKHNNLRLYSREWKKRYFNSYIKKLSLKLDNKLKLKIINLFKDNPELILRATGSDTPNIPKEIKNGIPLSRKLKIIRNYFFLKLKYLMMEVRFGKI